MKGLTVIQPWPWAICYWGKPVENRTWAPPAALIGERFAIHAGKLPGPRASGAFGGSAWAEVASAIESIDAEGLIPVGAPTLTPAHMFCASSAIVATVRLAGWVTPNPHHYRTASIDDGQRVRNAARSPWFSGPIGWVLADKVVLPTPIPCRGAQGLWTVPPDVGVRVRDQERLAA